MSKTGKKHDSGDPFRGLNNEAEKKSENDLAEVRGEKSEIDAAYSDDSWKGLLYIIPWLYHKIILIFLGESAAGKPYFIKKPIKYNFFLYLVHNIKEIVLAFFRGPKKEERDLNYVDKLASLLDVKNSNETILQKCKEYSRLHRIYENTKARKRLEKWASRIIAIYLLVVLLLVICNYINVSYFPGWLSFMNFVTFDIPDAVMITILSTTTVNIIGLGLIVLRGHFFNKDDLKDLEATKNNSVNEGNKSKKGKPNKQK